jgi:hypothetical protein
LRLKTSWAPRAALGLAVGASALAAVAPAASAQSPAQTDLRLSGISGIPSTIQAGDAFRLRVTVTNSGTRTARSARYFVALTRGNVAKSTGLRRLRTNNLPPYRAGRRSTFSTRIGIRPSSSGRYRVVICATQSGRRARCTLAGRSRSRAAPARRPGPAPAHADAPPTPRPRRRRLRPIPLDQQLRTAITQSELLEHTNAFADIAARNDNNRAASTQGYDDSAAYVINRLTKAGLDARIDRFEFILFSENAAPTLTTSVNATYAAEDFATMTYSGTGSTGTPPKAIVAVDYRTTLETDPPSTSTSGCEEADFAGFPRGAIALMQRGTCTFGVKAQNAVNAGAVGVISFNEGSPAARRLLTGTLGQAGRRRRGVRSSAPRGRSRGARRGETAGGTVTASITDGHDDHRDTLRTTSSSTHPDGDPDTTRSVVARTWTAARRRGDQRQRLGRGLPGRAGRADGAAEHHAGQPRALRLLGRRESGLVGSTAYVAGLSDEAFGQIAMNLNFDMLASPTTRASCTTATSPTRRRPRASRAGPGFGGHRGGVQRVLRLAGAGHRAVGLQRPVGLQALPGQRHPGRWPVLRGGGHQDGGRGRAVRRRRRGGVRPELPRGRGRSGQPRPAGVRGDGRRGSADHASVRDGRDAAEKYAAEGGGSRAPRAARAGGEWLGKHLQR